MKKPPPLLVIVVGAMLALFALVMAIAYVLHLGDQVRSQPSVSDELEFQCTVNGDTWVPEARACIRNPQQGLTDYDKQKILGQAQQSACEAVGGTYFGGRCSMPPAPKSAPASSQPWTKDYFCSRFPTAAMCSNPGEGW
jgi:hypothetical protein